MVTYEHVRREMNKDADRLSNLGMDANGGDLGTGARRTRGRHSGATMMAARRPAAGPVGPVGLEPVEVGLGAEASDVDVVRPQPGVQQQIAIGGPEVEAEPAGGVAREPGSARGRIVSRRGERPEQLFPHVVAAGADAGADRGDEVGASNGVLAGQRRDRGAGYVGRRAAPAGVHRRRPRR